MSHRPAGPPVRSALPVFVVALVGVLMIGVVWRAINGGGESRPTTATEVTDNTQGTDGTEAVGDTTPTDDSTPSDSEGPAPTEPAEDLPPITSFEFEVVADGLQQLTVVAAAPDDGRLFVAERLGRVKIVDASGALLEESFLNITDRVLANGIEQGLLGLAFHPDFATNGRFFVYYTNKDAQRTLSEFTVSTASPNQANHNSERILFSKPQPEGSTDIRHYGGGLHFGPDGYLWVSLGDGADSRDQGQDPGTIFAALLRLDVDSGEEPYGIPADNPFVSGGGAPEVWAYGLRNPWRYAIDHATRTVYVGDVGQGDREEINVLSIDTDAGANLGWANVEGTRCFFEDNCDPASYHLPTIEYDHQKGCSVTGGVVYRGSEIPELYGHYFYGDWCGQWLESFLLVDGVPTAVREWPEYSTGDGGLGMGQPNAFGNGADGELYIATHTGKLLKLVANR